MSVIEIILVVTMLILSTVYYVIKSEKHKSEIITEIEKIFEEDVVLKSIGGDIKRILIEECEVWIDSNHDGNKVGFIRKNPERIRTLVISKLTKFVI